MKEANQPKTTSDKSGVEVERPSEIFLISDLNALSSAQFLVKASGRKLILRAKVSSREWISGGAKSCDAPWLASTVNVFACSERLALNLRGKLTSVIQERGGEKMQINWNRLNYPLISWQWASRSNAPVGIGNRTRDIRDRIRGGGGCGVVCGLRSLFIFFVHLLGCFCHATATAGTECNKIGFNE